MSDDRNDLAVAKGPLENLCAHVSVRDDNGTPFLFAVGLKHVHSFELRRKEKSLVLDLWRGPPTQDEFVRLEHYTSMQEALGYCKRWLENDVA